ncbi:uncharacterized protein PgNI_02622 [Pyricularia grisea]|uniref:Cytochrome P450 n=1 Tax=Pyricularia grisea TaxID=148305 RepID=A0A6P8BH73_PYRGI|nr:uncharacterized protein PgNI_02622 [Pyricularia grisea]TLD16231.1 hypothetical protein PgNI_02622 [Pyricularia grisea]
MEKVYEYYRETPEGPISLLNAGPKEHAKLRKWFAPFFSDRGMKEQEKIISGYVDLIIRRLSENLEDGTRVLDVRNWFNFCTFNILGKLAFSSSFGCLELARYYPWEFMGYTIDKLNNRIKLGSRPDIIESLLNNKEGIKIDIKRLVQNSTLLIAAGFKTTATLLTATIYLFLTNSKAYDKVTDEVRNSFSDPSEINLTSVNKLLYMLVCLDEALRIFPVIPLWFPRRVTKHEAVINGNIIPQGTFVAIWQWPIYYSEKNFSKPLEYYPERFLGDPEFSRNRLDAVQPFNTGHANCIGRNLAYSEMRLILARIFFNFNLKFAD